MPKTARTTRRPKWLLSDEYSRPHCSTSSRDFLSLINSLVLQITAKSASRHPSAHSSHWTSIRQTPVHVAPFEPLLWDETLWVPSQRPRLNYLIEVIRTRVVSFDSVLISRLLSGNGHPRELLRFICQLWERDLDPKLEEPILWESLMVFSRTTRKIGRKVARETPVIPIPGSMIDQVTTFAVTSLLTFD